MRALQDLDGFLAELVGQAMEQVTPGEGALLLRRALRLSRLVARGPLHGHLVAALRQGDAPQSLAALESWIQGQQVKHRRTLRMSRAPMGGKQAPASPPVVDLLLTPGEVARELGVSPKTVANWCKQGLLRCEVLASGHRRIPSSALDLHRVSQASWRRVDALLQRQAPMEGCLEEDVIFGELAQRPRS